MVAYHPDSSYGHNINIGDFKWGILPVPLAYETFQHPSPNMITTVALISHWRVNIMFLILTN